MPKAVRIVLIAVGVPLVMWWAWAETWLVALILCVPVARVWWLEPGERLRKRAGMFAAVAGVGVVGALAMHVPMAQMLGGHVRPIELLWSAWFYTGCLSLLEGLDVLLSRGVQRWLKHERWRTLARAAVWLIVLPPAALAVMQSVRVKVGYTLSDRALAYGPVAFTTTTTDGRDIRGYFFDRGHADTVIVAHGVGAHCDNFMPYLLDVLKRNDVNGVIFDFRGHGYSDGHVASFGYHERHDVSAVVDWLRDAHPQRSQRIVMYSFSMGSAATMYALPGVERREPGLVRGPIIDSGFARLTDVAWALADQLPPPINYSVYALGLPLASAITQAPLWSVEPVEQQRTLDLPVRVVHGTADRVIPVEQGRVLTDELRATGAIVPGGSHTNLPHADASYGMGMYRFIDLVLADPTADNVPADADLPALRSPPSAPPRQEGVRENPQ